MFNFRRKRVWAGVFLLVIGGAFAAFRLMPDADLQREMEAWRRSGLPTNGMDLHLWYTAVPAERNAANFVLDAQAAFRPAKTKPDPHSIELPAPGTPLPKDALKAIEAHILLNQEALELLAKAATFRESRYPCNLWQGFSTLLPQLSSVKSMATLLKLEAVLHSSKGDRTKAVASIRKGFALARTLRNEPLLISELVRSACVSINLTALERVLSEHSLSSDEIAALQSDLDEAEADGRRGVYRALAGERAIGVAAFTTSFRELQALNGAAPPAGGAQFVGALGFTAYKATGLKQRDTRFYLQMMGAFIAAATNEFPAAIERATAAEKELTARLNTGLGKFAFMSRMLLPALTRAVQKSAVTAAKLRSARLALAVEAQRAPSGELPASLKDLSGDIPRDPFNNEPLRYERKERGYQIISGGATEVAKTKTHPTIGITVAR